MHHQAGWLSEDAHALQLELQKTDADELHCDLLIVGSGYGAAVAAARLSKLEREDGKPFRIMLIERGREYLPGMFPSRTADLPGHVRFSRQDGEAPKGPATALWDMRVGPDVNVVLGSGLGGGSLINAAVMERPEPHVWQSGWPRQIDAGMLAQAYTRAELALAVAKLPEKQDLRGGKELPKFEALQHLADGLPDRPRVRRCNLAVSFVDGKTSMGVEQKACKHCGDCATGCNWRAKNSLDTNYLALARRQNVAMYCGALAVGIEKVKDYWQLRWAPTNNELVWAGDATPIRCRHLIIGAGSLGSTELLQRSQLVRPHVPPAGDDPSPLRFSAALGSRFSTNGDMLAAAVRLPVETKICAEETTPVVDGKGEAVRNIGPTITGMLRSGTGTGRFVAQEFAIPAPLRTLLAELTGTLGTLQDLPRFDWSLHSPWQRGEEPLSPSSRALDRTMVYGLMGDDGAGGRLEPTRQVAGAPAVDALYDGRIAVQWPEARSAPVFDAQHQALSTAYSSKGRGFYLPNPAWRPLPDALDRLAQGKGVRGPITTVHPLGGCPMGDNVRSGVTDWAGRVFDAGTPGVDGTNVHKGLVVLDGAIVPKALGINPSLTITALAENAVVELARTWGLRPKAKAGQPPPESLLQRPVFSQPEPRPEQPATSVQILERVQGTLAIDGRRYWGEMQVRFAAIDDVAAFSRTISRKAPFEQVVLSLYADQLDKEDDPQWRAQRDVDVAPLFEVVLSGHADVFFRHWSWWPCRIWRSFKNVGSVGARIGPPWRWWPPKALLESIRVVLLKAAIASNIGEQRGIDYNLHVDSVSHPDCPLQPGDRLRGRKRVVNEADSNPWRQVSEMAMELRKGTGLFGSTDEPLGSLALDLRYFVQQRTALLALRSQPDMVTALADISTLAMLSLRVMLKIQLLKFVPPDKKDRSIAARRPGELPGLLIDRHNQGAFLPPGKSYITSYCNPNEPVTGPPMVLFHGFTASGSTFAHPSIPRNLVQYLCAQRRKVWVVELPTSIAFPKRDAEDMSFEEVADQIPNIIQYITAVSRSEQVDVLGHCIGAAMFCRAVLRDPDLHKSVRSLTLSQVGPLIQMSPANMLRGYLASYLAQFLGVKTLDARPNFEPGGANSLGQTLLDAVLASLPYPARDRERVLAEKATAQGRPDFRIVRHRADAMLGRLFELTDDSSIPEATLDALDDILGYARVQTLAQIIHYTRLSMLSDDDGRNREITSDALSRKMSYPVLMLHGRRSGVFDWRGSLESYEWLRHTHTPRLDPKVARVERDADKLHLGLGTPRQLVVFEKFGHQDSMIGTRAPDVVFPVIANFLRSVENAPRPKPDSQAAKVGVGGPNASKLPASPGSISGSRGATPWVAHLPWVGPVLGWVRKMRLEPGQTVQDHQVSFVLHPNPTHARTRFIAIVPMRRVSGAWQHIRGDQIGLWDDLNGSPEPEPLPLPNEIDTFDDEYEDEPIPGENEKTKKTDIDRVDLGPAMRNGALTLTLSNDQANGVDSAWLLLTVHDDMPGRPGPDPNKSKEHLLESLSIIEKTRRQALCAVGRFLADAPADLESGLLRVSQSVRDAGDRERNDEPLALDQRPRLTFCLMSCQYPAGVLDQALAQTSFRRLSARLDAPSSEVRKPQLLLQIGDQVYLDETAGLFEPVTRELAVEQIYDRSQGTPSYLSVTSRVPSYVMLDDHEVRDNWQPGLAREGDDKRLEAFRQRQACLNPGMAKGSRAPYSFKAAPGGWPLFVLDTRTQRESWSPAGGTHPEIIVSADMWKLIIWLQAQAPESPKFVATPSVIWPLERSLKVDGEPRWSSDGWAGFPESQSQLLGAIAQLGIRNVVFLSGDAHLSMFSRGHMQWHEQPAVPIYSIVSSGLYAPWRFANAEPAGYQQGSFKVPGGHITGVIDTKFYEANGFAVLCVESVAGGCILEVEFDLADGRHKETVMLT